MADHHFSKRVSNAFNEIGEYDFSNLVEHQSWSCRSRVIAKQRIYEKYIKPEDVYRAVMLQRNARNTEQGNWKAHYYWGQVYITEVLTERSGGLWKLEMKALMDNLPTEAEYRKKAFAMAYKKPKTTLEIAK